MLGTIIFSILFIILIIIVLKDDKKGIITYVIFSLISPNLNIGIYQVSFEILAFFPVLLILILKGNSIFAFYKKGLYRQYLWLYFFVFIMSSLISTLKYGGDINYIALLGCFRIICILYLLQFIINKNSNPSAVLDDIITPVILINLIVAFIQLTIPASTVIFYEFYYKESVIPLAEMLQLGYFNRAYGTFGTPVLLGVLSLFCFAVYLGFLTEKKKIKFIHLKLVFSIILGLMALSKTPILGIPLILLIHYLLILYGIIKIKNRKVLLVPLLIVPIAIVVISYLEKQGTSILWYVRYLQKPFESLTSRYDKASGLLSNTYSVIRDNLLIGVGSKSFKDVFIGDSMYVRLMYETGIIGTGIYLMILVSTIIKNIRYRNITALLCTIAICLAGFAIPVQSNIISIPLLAYIFCKSEKCLVN